MARSTARFCSSSTLGAPTAKASSGVSLVSPKSARRLPQKSAIAATKLAAASTSTPTAGPTRYPASTVTSTVTAAKAITSWTRPRSLASCYENLVLYLDHIARAYDRQGPAQRQARVVRARLENSRMEEIFQQGMHEFIGEFIESNNRLGAAITEQYLM